MKAERFDRRFALISVSGDRYYPYQKARASTGDFGFAIAPPGKADKYDQATYTTDLEKVIRKVINEGWNVRARRTSPSNDPGNCMTFGKHKIVSYELAKEFSEMVSTLNVKPRRVF